MNNYLRIKKSNSTNPYSYYINSNNENSIIELINFLNDNGYNINHKDIKYSDIYYHTLFFNIQNQKIKFSNYENKYNPNKYDLHCIFENEIQKIEFLKIWENNNSNHKYKIGENILNKLTIYGI